MYVKITAWLSLLGKIEEINPILKEYRLGLRRYLKTSSIISEYFNYNTIVDLRISESRVKLNKTTFFELGLTFYQKNEETALPLVKPKNENVKELRPLLEQITNEILELDLFTNNKYFRYHLLKEDAKEMFKVTID